MPLKARSLSLTKSQAACLNALRNGKVSKPEIAIHAKLDVAKTATTLGTLARLGLAKQDEAKRWHVTARGKTCRFRTVPDRLRRNSGMPGSGGRRLLRLLDRPMRGNEIVEKLRISHQRVRQLVIKLHAQGRVTFGDLANPFWIIRRTDDGTPLLSRDEEHVLSAVPREYVTNVTKIRLAARMPENKVQKIIEALVANRFVEEFEGLQGSRVYRLTAAGKIIPNAINVLTARRCRACLLNQTESVSAFNDTGLGGAAHQRRDTCTKNSAQINKRAHAVSQAKAFGKKNGSSV